MKKDKTNQNTVDKPASETGERPASKESRDSCGPSC